MNDAVTLFSGGAGAWELGAEWAGVRVVASCEKEPIRREFLRANFGEDHLVFEDVETLTGAALRSALAVSGSWRPRFLFASPPCQDASVANHAGRGLDGERTGLFRHAVRLVHELRPDGVAFENVSGLTAREAHTILEWLGPDYRGWVHRVGDEDVGAPQRAWRRIICAVRIAETAGLGQRSAEVAGRGGGESRPPALHGRPSTPAQEPVRRRGQPLHAAPDERCVAAVELEHGRERSEGSAHAAHTGAAQTRRSARDDRSLARSETTRGEDRRFDPRDWRDDAGEALCGRLRMANGLSGGLALNVQEAYGDAFPPLLAQCVIEALRDAMDNEAGP